jgi:hypothetical protein
MAERLPDLLTVEEAADVLRIGRTKAYAMAREWRRTGGESGLPVLDFGYLLRVPRHALEQLLGAELHAQIDHDGSGSVPATSVGDASGTTPTTARAEPVVVEPPVVSQLPGRPSTSRALRRRRPSPPSQLQLFESSPTEKQ